MKKVLIYIIIAILLLVGIFQIWKYCNIKRYQVPVLVYHNIVLSEKEKEKDADALTVDDFKEQMNYLKENGYEAISMDDFYNWKTGSNKIPEKSVVITFDDGFYSFKYLVEPILQQYDFNATCFVIGKVTMLETPKYEAERYGTIGLDEINSKPKNITYGSHTFYLHEQGEDGKPIVKNKNYEEIKQDTEKFNKELFDAKYLAYPYYTYTKDFIKILKEENYRLAFAGEEEMACKDVNNYKIPRISGVRNLEEFKQIFETNKYRNKYGNSILRKIFVKINRIMFK